MGMNSQEHGIQIKRNKEAGNYTLLLDGRVIGNFSSIEEAWNEGNAMLERLIQKERKIIDDQLKGA